MRKLTVLVVAVSLVLPLAGIIHAQSTSTPSNDGPQAGISSSTPSRIHGGTNFDTAIAITPGTYQLDHHQHKGEYDYFKLTTSQDKLTAITLQNSQKAIDFSGGQWTTNCPGVCLIWGGFEVHAADKQRIAYFTTFSSLDTGSVVLWPRNEGFEYQLYEQTRTRLERPGSWFPNATSGSAYVLIGNNSGDQSQDVTFDIEEFTPTPEVLAAPAPANEPVASTLTDWLYDQWAWVALLIIIAVAFVRNFLRKKLMSAGQ